MAEASLHLLVTDSLYYVISLQTTNYPIKLVLTHLKGFLGPIISFLMVKAEVFKFDVCLGKY